MPEPRGLTRSPSQTSVTSAGNTSAISVGTYMSKLPQGVLPGRCIFVDKDDCRNYLQYHGVEAMGWGTGKAKRVEDLMKELEEGECWLELHEGKAVRVVGVVKLIVRNPQHPGHHLVCVGQQMADGRRRPRNVLLSEKMRPREPPRKAALRAVEEELQSARDRKVKLSDHHADQFALNADSHKHWVETIESPSYPHLSTRYHLHQSERRRAAHAHSLRPDPRVCTAVTTSDRARAAGSRCACPGCRRTASRRSSAWRRARSSTSGSGGRIATTTYGTRARRRGRLARPRRTPPRLSRAARRLRGRRSTSGSSRARGGARWGGSWPL